MGDFGGIAAFRSVETHAAKQINDKDTVSAMFPTKCQNQHHHTDAGVKSTALSPQWASWGF